MTLRGIARNVVPALFICAVAVFTAGCPLKVDITTKGGGRDPGTIAKGTWCCSKCGPGSVKCTGCYTKTADACVSGQPIILDCTGTTTQEGSTVTCY
jgi:hypothetical protein